MTTTQTPSKAFSRRRALQLLSSAPLLPIAAASPMFVALSACGGSGGDAAPAASVKSTSFQAMAAPTLANPQAMATTTVGSSLVANYSDGSSQTLALKYEPFFITGSAVPDSKGGSIVAGSYWDIFNQPIKDASAPDQRQFFSDSPDGMSLLTLSNPTVTGIKGNTVFAVVQFEYTTADAAGQSKYGQLPSPIAVLTLDQDKATGKLNLVKYHNVDTSSVNGLWITCGASLSPWNTHLSSEEYEPDAFAASNAQLAAFSTALYGNPTTANPYHYGHLPEVTVQPDGTGTIVKHYGMGRISHELVAVLPDERTVLMGDDATNGGAFMFIADKARDLSSGTLYVGKWNQTSGTGPGAATLSWIKLGKTTSADIRKLVDSGIKAGRHHGGEDGRSRRCILHEDSVRGQVQLDQSQAGYGAGRVLPGNAPLRRAQRWQHGLHQVGRHDVQREGQGRLHRHVTHRVEHAQWFRAM